MTSGLAPGHQRAESTQLYNYSLLSVYGCPSPEPPPAGPDPVDITDDTAPNASTLSLAPSASTRSSAPPEARIVDVATPDGLREVLALEYDRYGFRKLSSIQKLTPEQYNEWLAAYAEHAAATTRKWHVLMKSSGLGGADPTRFPPKLEKTKRLVRKGIPAQWRGSAWFFYAGGHERLHKHTGVYERIVGDTAGAANKDTEVIERDLHRTFPDNRYFRSGATEAAAIGALRRVLTAFAHYQPHIGYCQLLNFLAGLLLLFMPEERAFWMLVILTERIIPKVHLATLEGVHVDQGVLMLCIKEYIPLLWAVLGKNFDGEPLSEDRILARLPPVTLVTSSWFMSLFVGVLPVETTLRVWDILWYEGSKLIFRILLTICRMCWESPELAQRQVAHTAGETDQIELFQYMQSFPKTLLDPNELIHNCFKKIGGYGFGLLSQDEINKCREFVLKQRARLSKRTVAAAMSDDERRALDASGIHDIYGFNRLIMSGVAWNTNIRRRMKKKLIKK